MYRTLFIGLFLLIIYGMILVPFSNIQKDRSSIVKLGYLPSHSAISCLLGDQATLFAELSVLKVTFYYGTLIEKWQKNILLRPEYYNMFKMLETAVKLDPYNMDAYYFSQAAFTWDVGRAEDVNRLLEYGMKYRSWDYYLPYFAGFNAAYFLHDYADAAKFMKRAAELSGNPLLINLAARYYYESGDSAIGMAFLDEMIRNSRNPQERKVYELRRKALEAVDEILIAMARYQAKYAESPKALNQLVDKGFLVRIPVDPYGGQFFIDQGGQVRSTSHFALPIKKSLKSPRKYK